MTTQVLMWKLPWRSHREREWSSKNIKVPRLGGHIYTRPGAFYIHFCEACAQQDVLTSFAKSMLWIFLFNKYQWVVFDPVFKVLFRISMFYTEIHEFLSMLIFSYSLLFIPHPGCGVGTGGDGSNCGIPTINVENQEYIPGSQVWLSPIPVDWTSRWELYLSFCLSLFLSFSNKNIQPSRQMNPGVWGTCLDLTGIIPSQLESVIVSTIHVSSFPFLPFLLCLPTSPSLTLSHTQGRHEIPSWNMQCYLRVYDI